MSDPSSAANRGSSGRTAYGSVLRERGTRRIVVGFLVLAAAWWAYSTWDNARLMSVKWPELQPDPAGLTVVGLQNKDRPGFRHRYIVQEAGRAWRFRLRDDDDADPNPYADIGSPTSKTRDRDEPERPVAEAVRSRAGTRGGRIVTVEEIVANCPTVLTTRHFSGASLSVGYEPLIQKEYYKVDIGLTREGRSRYYQFATQHMGERLVFVIGNQAITCPVITQATNVGSFTISPVWTKADAEKLVEVVTRKR
jgi:hypothetical protein